MKTEAFQTWLHDRHGKMMTPRHVVEAVVTRAVNSGVASLQRLIVGQENEVYNATTENGQSLIVRISHSEDPRFEAERWALNAARQYGVPTPNVFLVETADLEDRRVTFCIEEKLPGVSLEKLIESGTLPEQAIGEIGDVLSRIHRVKVEGFGYLQPNGNGWNIPFSHIMLDLLEKETDLHAAARHWGMPTGTVDAGLALLQKHTALYEWNTPFLAHGDFVPAHLLVNQDAISGVIDFQECSGNHPVFDFVLWKLHWGEVVPVETLFASYGNKALFDAAFQALFSLALLRHCLWMLMVHREEENPQDVDVLKQSIGKVLASFS